MRKCRECSYEGPIETFPAAGKQNGRQFYRRVCLDCYRALKNKRVVSLRDFINGIKAKLSCERCGFDDTRAIDFHHIDPKEKVFNISRAARRGFSQEKIKAEIAKCTPLCSNCHRIVEAELREVK